MKANTMEDALNKQINEELFSSFLYLSMSAWFEEKNLRGFAHWMRVQFGEEQKHAEKFYRYLVERGWRVKLDAIAKPQFEWESPLSAFEAAYAHEKHITKCIHTLMDQAVKEKDYATQGLLQWFVNEQVEEEGSTLEIVEKLRMIGDKSGALYMIDREMSGRK